MSVKLRKQKIKKGHSLYLDCYDKGKRWKEYLNVYIYSDDPERSKKMKFAEYRRIEREFEIAKGDHVIQDLNEIFIEDYFKKFLDRYKKTDVRKYKTVSEHVSFFGSRLLSNISELECEEFREYLRSKFKPATVSTYFNCFRRVLNTAIKEGYLKYNPSKGVRIRLDNSQIYKQILTQDEIVKIARTKTKYIETKRAFLLACVTGLGELELKRLKFNDINNNQIKCIRGKDLYERIVIIDLNKDALNLIGSGEGYVFKLQSTSAIKIQLQLIIKDAKINKHITFYCARHSFACNLLLSGADLKTVKELMGHSSIETTLKYLKFVDQLKSKAVNNLNSFT